MFITMEGADGCGKSTQAWMLGDYLSTLNIAHILTKEPGTPLVESCKKIRELLLDPKHNLCNRAEFFLYLADRAEHVEKCIIPALYKGQWVISDRYFDSTKVYQGIARGLGIDVISPMISYATKNVMPDVTFIMDLPSEIGLARAKASNKEFAGGDRIEREGIAFHKKLREGFLEIAKTEKRYIVLDANRSVAEIHADVKTHLSKYFIRGGS